MMSLLVRVEHLEGSPGSEYKLKWVTNNLFCALTHRDLDGEKT